MVRASLVCLVAMCPMVAADLNYLLARQLQDPVEQLCEELREETECVGGGCTWDGISCSDIDSTGQLCGEGQYVDYSHGQNAGDGV